MKLQGGHHWNIFTGVRVAFQAYELRGGRGHLHRAVANRVQIERAVHHRGRGNILPDMLRQESHRCEIEERRKRFIQEKAHGAVINSFHSDRPPQIRQIGQDG
jgi:hypothetical protein